MSDRRPGLSVGVTAPLLSNTLSAQADRTQQPPPPRTPYIEGIQSDAGPRPTKLTRMFSPTRAFTTAIAAQSVQNLPPGGVGGVGSLEEPTQFAKYRSLLFASFNVGNAALGAGVLAFPYANERCGWGLMMVLMVVVAPLVGYTAYKLACYANEYGADSYQELVCEIFPDSVRVFLLYVVTFFSFMGCVSYLLVASSEIVSLVHSAVPDGDPDAWYLKEEAYMLIIPVVLYPLCIARSIDKLGAFSGIGVIAVIVTCASVGYHGVQTPVETPAFKPEVYKIKFGVFQAIPVICFGMMCHMTVIPAIAAIRPYWPAKEVRLLSNITQKPRAANEAIVMVMVGVTIGCMLLYSAIGYLGYLAFGSSTNSDILSNFGVHRPDGAPFIADTLDIKLARVCMICTVSLGYPVLCFVARLGVLDIIGAKDKPFTWRRTCTIATAHCALSSAIAIGATLAGLDLGFVIGVMGCTCAVIVQLFFPGAMLIRIERRRVAGTALIIFGAGVLFLGLFSTIGHSICKSLQSTEDAGSGSGMGDVGETGVCSWI